jgi:NADH-quinone oxidoreductase subunit A
MLPAALVAYLALFATVGFLFLLVSLCLGKVLRARVPTAQKLAIYECGEPAVGSGAVQFDLRFYVVALVFLIFEVEVAFFFPPATIFGQSVHILAPTDQPKTEIAGPEAPAAKAEAAEQAEQGAQKTVLTPFSARAMARAAMVDLGVFFAVLLVAFAFVWRRGDLNWVRSLQHPATPLERAALTARLRQDDV